MSAINPKTWFALDVLVEADAAEAIESAFNVLGVLGTEIDSLGKPRSGPQTVSGYFELLPDAELAEAAFVESLRICGFPENAIKSVARRIVEQTDWLAEWKKHWKPTTVGRFIITPPWETVDPGDKHVIVIEPNMAFGTGTHETTQLCLQAIGELYTPGQRFLDVGTGTGILAIAAAKLGGVEILACDTDQDSVRLARENAAANGVAKRINFYHGPIDEDTPVHDVVCANLTADVIVPILPMLVAIAAKTLVLSGILAEQEYLIVEGLHRLGATEYRIERSGEWIAVIIDQIS